MGLYMKMNKTIIFLGLMFLFGMGQVISMEQPTPEVEIDEDGIANGLVPSSKGQCFDNENEFSFDDEFIKENGFRIDGKYWIYLPNGDKDQLNLCYTLKTYDNKMEFSKLLLMSEECESLYTAKKLFEERCARRLERRNARRKNRIKAANHIKKQDNREKEFETAKKVVTSMEDLDLVEALSQIQEREDGETHEAPRNQRFKWALGIGIVATIGLGLAVVWYNYRKAAVAA